MTRIIVEWIFRKWYWYINKLDKNDEVLFLNYGYHDKNEQVNLCEEYERHRFPIQLYNKLVSFADLRDKSVCEVGCGRGGGLSYIHKEFAPSNSVGVDIDQKSVEFCSQFHKAKGLSFVQGDAQNLPFKDEVFDIVINTESSHRYLFFNNFISEVYRTLKSGGYLLLTDFRRDYRMDEMKSHITESDFEVTHYELINNNIVLALEADDERRREMVERLVPRYLRKTALNFAGAIGSDTYEKYRNYRFLYFIYILRKP